MIQASCYELRVAGPSSEIMIASAHLNWRSSIMDSTWWQDIFFISDS